MKLLVHCLTKSDVYNYDGNVYAVHFLYFYERMYRCVNVDTN